MTVALHGVSRWFGETPALLEVSAAFGPGLHLVAGDNGAGKTTLLAVAAGLVRPSAGDVVISGRAGMATAAPLDRAELSAPDLVRLGATAAGRGRPRADATLAELGLDPDDGRPLSARSREARQLAKVAHAVVAEPDVLLLDEPFEHAGAAARALIAAAVRDAVERGACVLVAAHVPAHLPDVACRTVRLRRGRLEGHA